MKSKEKNILSRRSAGEKVLFGFVFALFALYALTLLFALFFIVVLSLKGKLAYGRDLFKGEPFAFPAWGKIDFKNYMEAIQGLQVQSSGVNISLLDMFFNSAWYTILSSLGGVFVSSFVAYALTKYQFIGKEAIYTVIIFTMTIPIIGSSGSTYKLLASLKILDTPFFLLTALSGFGFNFMILYGFFKSLPWSYAEAVFIDGGGHFTAFFKIMLPQAKSSIFALFIMAWIGAWNDYSTPILYMRKHHTLASGLYELQSVSEKMGDVPLYYAGLTMSIIPVIVLFIFCSDTIMENMTVGGLKG